MPTIIERELEPKVLQWLDRKEIIAIRGPRQCGKTTLLKKLAELLHAQGIADTNIHYLTFEDDVEKEKFEKNPLDYITLQITNKERHFFLMDEVQYIKSAGKLLKLVYDTVENIKIVITGSSTLDLNEIGSFLVGRVILLEMYPFSFKEFLRAKDEALYNYYLNQKIDILKPKIRKEEIIHLDQLNKLLKEYLTFGGYPAIVLEKDHERKKTLLKNLFQTYIEKDVVKIYGSKYAPRISHLIKHLAAVNTSIINYNEISSAISLYDQEVKVILQILEDTYIIKLLRPFYKNLATELRKNPKAYFIDVGLRNSATERFDFSEEEYGKLLENYIFNIIREEKVNYWRTTAKAEVDFILNEQIPLESKTSPKITRSFRSFIEHYHPEKAFLVNMSIAGKKQLDKTKIFIVPFALLSLR